MISEKDVKYRHLINFGKNNGYTLGWIIKDNLLYVSFSICGKNDQYSRKIGREIVFNRLNDLIKQKDDYINYSHVYSLEDFLNFQKNTVNLFGHEFKPSKGEEFYNNLTFDDFTVHFIVDSIMMMNREFLNSYYY